MKHLKKESTDPFSLSLPTSEGGIIRTHFIRASAILSLMSILFRKVKMDETCTSTTKNKNR
jgi:hypothetical protein